MDLPKSIEDVHIENNNELGKGSYSKVFKVRSKKTNQIFALKSINFKYINDN